MPTRAVHMVIDATDPSRLAAFWVAALGSEVAADEPDEAVAWPAGFGDPDEAVVSPAGFGYPDAAARPLVFVPVGDAKIMKSRVQVDVAPPPRGDVAAEVRRPRVAGAVPVDVGQGDVKRVVLADPEGNEFCVLTPR